MKKKKEDPSVYYDTDFEKMAKLTKRVEKLELMEMELAAEKQIRKKAEKHIEELVKIIKEGK
jgi:hypothetical protein